jgi:hypothetical protein
MAETRAETIDFEPLPMDEVLRIATPLRRLLSPVTIGIEHVPHAGAVLLTGNHTVYGVLDIPLLGLELYEKTGRLVRGPAITSTRPAAWRDLCTAWRARHARPGARAARRCWFPAAAAR